ncbi:hypothetical protein M0Q97_06500 [Candidatus Dojkabacteria bacterium]|jgi:hypothetical protein|nr:hypothetical protein [Candidatus Dojkabacteria bacterium]
MPKTRLNITGIEILCKNIINIVIDDMSYNRDNFTTSQDIQNFYRHILKSKNKIKYIKYHKIEGVIQQKCLVEMYLDNEVLHNFLNYAYCEKMKNNHIIFYYIYGQYISYFDWLELRKSWLRSEKLKRIVT